MSEVSSFKSTCNREIFISNNADIVSCKTLKYKTYLNIVKNVEFVQRNGIFNSNFYMSIQNFVSERLKKFNNVVAITEADRSATILRMITCISWHPSSRYFISGTKSGDINMFSFLDKYDSFKEIFHWPGSGPRSSVLCIHYLKNIVPNTFISASLNGKVNLWNLELPSFIPIKTFTSDDKNVCRFCSVNSCELSNCILVGATNGVLVTLDKNLKVISSHKIHDGRINTVDFVGNDGWTFITASNDTTVKIYDIRKLKDEITVLKHNTCVVSAFCSKINSGRILTSLDNWQVHIYKGPLWRLERRIKQRKSSDLHYNNSIATWHPNTDLIVVGHPPVTSSDTSFCNLIDIYSADTGLITNKLYHLNSKRLSYFNEFSPSGEYLISTTGTYFLLWKLESFNDTLK